MRIEGQLIEVRHQSGDFKGNDGHNVAWENVLLRIFDGQEVVVIKCKADAVPAAMQLQGAVKQMIAVEVDSARQVETRTLTAEPLRPPAQKAS